MGLYSLVHHRHRAQKHAGLVSRLPRLRSCTGQRPSKAARVSIRQTAEPLLSVRGLCKRFPIRKGLFGKTVGHVRRPNFNLNLYPGESIGLVWRIRLRENHRRAQHYAPDRTHAGHVNSVARI